MIRNFCSYLEWKKKSKIQSPLSTWFLGVTSHMLMNLHETGSLAPIFLTPFNMLKGPNFYETHVKNLLFYSENVVMFKKFK